MFVLSIVLAVLSGLTLVVGMAWALVRFGRKVVRFGPEAWQEMQPQGQIQVGCGTGVTVESRVSVRLCDMKAAWRSGRRREVMPFFLGMAGLLGLFLFIGLAMLLAETTVVRVTGGFFVACFAYGVWFTVSGLNEDPGIPAEASQADRPSEVPASAAGSALAAPDHCTLAAPGSMAKALRQVGLVFLVVGLGPLLFGVYDTARTVSFVRHSALAQGTIADCRVTGHSDNYAPMYAEIIQYIGPGGTPITYETKWSSTRKPEIGTPVTVRYRLDDPQQACEDTFLTLWGLAGGATLLGTLSTGAGIAFWAVFRRKEILLRVRPVRK